MRALTVQEIANLSTDELIEHLACAHDANNEEPTDDCNPILRELLTRDEISKIPDELLRDVLSSLLPIHPNGDVHLRKLQIALANDIVMPDDTDYPDWIQVMDNDSLMHDFSVFVSDNQEGSDLRARQLYREIRDRYDRGALDWNEKASTGENNPIRANMDTVVYSFIRRQLPKVGNKNFRTVAESMLNALI